MNSVPLPVAPTGPEEDGVPISYLPLATVISYTELGDDVALALSERPGTWRDAVVVSGNALAKYTWTVSEGNLDDSRTVSRPDPNHLGVLRRLLEFDSERCLSIYLRSSPMDFGEAGHTASGTAVVNAQDVNFEGDCELHDPEQFFRQFPVLQRAAFRIGVITAVLPPLAASCSTTLLRLSLSNPSLGASCVDAILRLAVLEELRIPGVNFTDGAKTELPRLLAGLSQTLRVLELKRAKQIDNVVFSSCDITMPKLEIINVRDTRVGNSLVEWAAKSAPVLRELHAAQTSISCGAADAMIQMGARLEVLDLGGTRFQNSGLQALEDLIAESPSLASFMPRLHTLGLGNTASDPPTNASMRTVARCVSLRHLHVPRSAVGIDGLLLLKPIIPQLVTLNLADTRVNLAGSSVLGEATSLEALFLAHCTVADRDLLQLGSLRKLKLLDLSRTDITGETLGVLQRARRLETLILNRCLKLNEVGAGVLLKKLSHVANRFIGGVPLEKKLADELREGGVRVW